MGCGERPPCGSRGGGPDSRPFARASVSLRKRKVFTMRKFKSKKGFTLAELLVTVAIIAVLVAVVIPVFGSQVKKAKQATDDANLRSARTVVTMNYLDHGCVASDCTGNCGTTHDRGCWFDVESGQILSASTPTQGYNQLEKTVDYTEYGGGIHTLAPDTAVIWTGNSSVDKIQAPGSDFYTIDINIYWAEC